MAHRHFLVMGGFHVVEPSEVTDRSIQSTKSNMDTQARMSHQQTQLFVKKIEKEKGDRPSKNKPEPEPEEGGVTILTLGH